MCARYRLYSERFRLSKLTFTDNPKAVNNTIQTVQNKLKPNSPTTKPYDLEDQHIVPQPNGPKKFLNDLFGEIVMDDPKSGDEIKTKFNTDVKSDKDCVIRFDTYKLILGFVITRAVKL